MTLLALGYTGVEVMQALQALSSEGKLAENVSADDLDAGDDRLVNGAVKFF